MNPIILHNGYMLTKINKIGQLPEKGRIFPITTDITISCELMQYLPGCNTNLIHACYIAVSPSGMTPNAQCVV